MNVLEKETDETTLLMMQLYFDNDKNTGGSSVRLVERIGENEALVYFEDSTSKKLWHILLSLPEYKSIRANNDQQNSLFQFHLWK